VSRDFLPCPQLIRSDSETLQDKLAKLVALREALNDDDVAQELEDAFGHSNGAHQRPGKKPAKKRSKRTKYGSAFDRIRQFFVDRGNEWATFKEIGEATGIPDGTLRANLYRTKVDEFDRESQKGFGKPTNFRMKK
jgi:hypothetical protein